MTNTSERRRPRAAVRFKVEYRGPTYEGTGTVLNISKSGALIADADRLLMTGSEITLRFSFFEDSIPVEVPAQVVRETDRGFGVNFTKVSPRTRSVLGMAISRLRQSGALGDDDEAADSTDEDITLMKI